MNILSCFDGMSCGQLALNKAGIKYDKYYASEIDKYSIKITQKNFPDTIQIGDIRNIKAIDLPKIDLILAGSPCQGFSFAGTRLNFEHPESKLFFEFVRILKECQSINPDILFLLENVKMSKEHEIIISRYCGREPIIINSALVSAQNRVRLYWTNIYNEVYGLFGEVECIISQPKDKLIFLKDILENNVGKKYYLKNKKIKYIDIKKNHIQWDLSGKGYENQDQRAFFETGKHGTLSSSGAQNKAKVVIAASRGRNPENPTSRKPGLNTEQTLEFRTDNKTNCLTNVQKDNYIILLSDSGLSRKRNIRIDKSDLLRSNNGCSHNNYLFKNNFIRRLTPIECERLQTVPDNYTHGVSDAQRYKMLGNGWTVDVIAHILKYITGGFQ